MIQSIREYLGTLTARFSEGWNRFWFTPSDTTTLGALRVLVGLLALYFHLSWCADLVPLLSTEGLISVETVEQLGPGRTTFSYYNLLHSPGELWTAHLLGAAVLLLLTVGVLTRVTSVLSLIVVLSLVHRAPLVTAEAEPILTMLLFYLCLVPAGRSLSVDAWRARRKAGSEAESPAPTWTATVATRLIQVHLSALYLLMALVKIGGDTWWEGSAVWWLITRTEQRLIDMTWLHAHPFAINLWTHSIVLFELVFGLLIWNRTARPLLLGISGLMWLSLALVTGKILFCTLMFVAGLAFVSPIAMRSFLAKRTPATGQM